MWQRSRSVDPLAHQDHAEKVMVYNHNSSDGINGRIWCLDVIKKHLFIREGRLCKENLQDREIYRLKHLQYQGKETKFIVK